MDWLFIALKFLAGLFLSVQWKKDQARVDGANELKLEQDEALIEAYKDKDKVDDEVSALSDADVDRELQESGNLRDWPLVRSTKGQGLDDGHTFDQAAGTGSSDMAKRELQIN